MAELEVMMKQLKVPRTTRNWPAWHTDGDSGPLSGIVITDVIFPKGDWSNSEKQEIVYLCQQSKHP
jgi:hypothetical protein